MQKGIAANAVQKPAITYAHAITIFVFIPEYLVANSFLPAAKMYRPKTDLWSKTPKKMAKHIR